MEPNTIIIVKVIKVQWNRVAAVKEENQVYSGRCLMQIQGSLIIIRIPRNNKWMIKHWIWVISIWDSLKISSLRIKFSHQRRLLRTMWRRRKDRPKRMELVPLTWKTNVVSMFRTSSCSALSVKKRYAPSVSILITCCTQLCPWTLWTNSTSRPHSKKRSRSLLRTSRFKQLQSIQRSTRIWQSTR